MNDQGRDPEKEGAAPYWSPYLAGFGLGLTLLVSYWLLGTGLGASAAVARSAAWFEHLILPGHVEGSAYFGKWFSPGSPHVLKYYLVSIAGIVVWTIAIRAKRQARANLALVGASIVVGLYLMESFLLFSRYGDPSVQRERAAADLGFGDDLPVIMTEKDAVKCQAFAPEQSWFLQVSAAPDKRFADELLALLRS